MRLRHLALIVMVIIAAAVPAAADPDLWIWRDRWNNMGQVFQDGYITGVLDAVETIGRSFNSPDVVRWAHTGIASRFPTIKSAVEWTNAGITKGTDPLAIVADTILGRLIRHGNGYDEDEVSSGSHFGAIWKDRWEREWSQSPGGDGYAAGVFDIIRGLDNAGKSPDVLRADVRRAAGMLHRLEQRTHRQYPLLSDIIKAVRSAISRSEDPTENMALAIFEAMRRY